MVTRSEVHCESIFLTEHQTTSQTPRDGENYEQRIIGLEVRAAELQDEIPKLSSPLYIFVSVQGGIVPR